MSPALPIHVPPHPLLHQGPLEGRVPIELMRSGTHWEADVHAP